MKSNLRHRVIVLVAALALVGSVAFGSPNTSNDAPVATEATTSTTLDQPGQDLDAFAERYQEHLIETWVNNTNWNTWMAAAAEYEEGKAVEAAKRVEETTTTTVVEYNSSAGCGGNLPPCCVMHRESGGNITAKNPTSSASGKWQFINSTWGGYGGYAEAWMAPESVQDAKAAELWAGGAGASHWGGGC